MDYEVIDNDLVKLLTGSDKGKYGKYQSDAMFMRGLQRTFAAFRLANTANDLYGISYLHYEALSGDKSGLNSCRIVNSSPMRLLIRERDDKLFISIISMEDYHK